MIEHPGITQINRTGYPIDVKEPEIFGTDALGNEVFVGDEIYVFEDEFFLIETLAFEGKEILKILGAKREIAE